MNEAGRDFGQRCEDEAPLMQPRMRRLPGLPPPMTGIAVEEQIQVDKPGPPPLLTDAAHFLLDIQEERKKFVRADCGFERENGVYEGRLLDGPHRLRAVERRGGEKFYAWGFFATHLAPPEAGEPARPGSRPRR